MSRARRAQSPRILGGAGALARGLLTAALVGTGAAAPAASAQELTIQARWRLLAITVEVDEDLALAPLLGATADAIERELPGLEVVFDMDHLRAYPGPAEGVRLSDEGLVRFGMRAAQADGIAVADYDVVFVLSPLYRGRFFGFSHVDFDAADGRMARGAAVQTEPAALILRSARGALDGEAPPPGFPAPAEPGPIGKALRRPLRALLERAEAPIEGLLALPFVREAILAPTLAHELAHFFAPGDLDVRDGYQAEWMPHATGDGDALNPWGHGVECCMYKGRDLGFYARKLIAMRGKVVVFCDRCRERLGCARPEAPTPDTPAPDAPPEGR